MRWFMAEVSQQLTVDRSRSATDRLADSEMNESPQLARRGLPRAVDCRLSTVDSLPFTPDSLPAAADVLLRGGVVILPTETVYGVACHPDFPAAL